MKQPNREIKVTVLKYLSIPTKDISSYFLMSSFPGKFPTLVLYNDIRSAYYYHNFVSMWVTRSGWKPQKAGYFTNCKWLNGRRCVTNMHYWYISFYPSFRMYFNLLTLVVCMTLSTCRAPVFPYRNFGIRCFQLKQNGVTTWNV